MPRYTIVRPRRRRFAANAGETAFRSGARRGVAGAARESECRIEDAGSYRQYDSIVQSNTVIGPGGDAAVLRIKGFVPRAGDEGRFKSADVRDRSVYRRGRHGVRSRSQRGVHGRSSGRDYELPQLRQSRAARDNVATRFEESKVCATPPSAFDTPVISGNVSLYNETEGRAIPPTPTIAWSAYSTTSPSM